jgi:hypothetical protein
MIILGNIRKRNPSWKGNLFPSLGASHTKSSEMALKTAACIARDPNQVSALDALLQMSDSVSNTLEEDRFDTLSTDVLIHISNCNIGQDEFTSKSNPKLSHEMDLFQSEQMSLDIVQSSASADSLNASNVCESEFG